MPERPKGYPEDFLAACERGISSVGGLLLRTPDRYRLYLILDHLVPVISDDLIKKVNRALSNSGSPVRVRLEDDGVVAIGGVLETETAKAMRPYAFSSHATTGAESVFKVPVNQLLDQLITRCDQILETSPDRERTLIAGVLGEILEDVRAERVKP